MNIINMNHSWKYIPDYKKEYIHSFPKAKEVSIPHANVETPFNNFSEELFQFISSYEKTIHIEKKKKKRYILTFEGVMTYAQVYVNEKLVVSHKGGYTPFKVDVTKELKSGENKIFVMVDSTEREDIPPFGFVIDYLTYGGIYREVYLEERDENFVDMVFVDSYDGTLHVRTFLDFGKKQEVSLTYVIKKNHEEVHTFTQNQSTNDHSFSEKVQLENWELSSPILYDLEVYLDGKLSYQTRFGNRKVEMLPSGFYLNGNKIKLYGLNRHQSFPYVGYAMPSNAQRKDADILKYELGVNTVRSSHYPPSRHFLDRCDEIGLLVFNEIPGWQHIGDEAWQVVAIENVKEMIYRDYNHPSIFIWGTRINESPDNDAFYEKTNAMAKSLDTSRPTGGVRNFEASNLIEDVYTFNDFEHRGHNRGLRTRKEAVRKEAPYLVTEFNGHMYPTKKFDDEFHRVNHVKRHVAVQHANFKDDQLIGAIGWCMFDYNTHQDFGSGDRICYHGVMDMFRIPKYAGSFYASQSDYQPVLEVTSNMNIGEKEASELTELLVLTNADYVNLYFNDQLMGPHYPSEKWSSLPHPPIVIEDFVGNLIHDNEPYTKEECDLIKETLLHFVKYGEKFPLRMKYRIFKFFRKYKLSFDKAAYFYEKYVGKWGQKSIQYRIDAIKDGMVVKSLSIGSTNTHKLIATIDDEVLMETETYQTTRVIVKHVNQNHNPMTYSTEVIEVKTEGPIQLIGPHLLALSGGSTGFYVRTIGEKGPATIRIKNTNYDDIIIELTVK